jgi:type II secretory pathway component GspD/PulD (secretin)
VDLKQIVSADANGSLQTNRVPLGPTLDVIPTVEPDGQTIQMTVIPTVTEFLGYAIPGTMLIEAQEVSDTGVTLPPNYPVRETGNNTVAKPFPQPRFRVRQMSVRTNVLDGQTLVLGGSTTTDISFQKSSEQVVTQTNHLIVFVTPTIVDPAGNRVRTDE